MREGGARGRWGVVRGVHKGGLYAIEGLWAAMRTNANTQVDGPVHGHS